MEDNKPQKIVVVGNGQDKLINETLALLKGSYDVLLLTEDEARQRGLKVPLIIEKGVLYFIQNDPIPFTITPHIPNIYIETPSKQKRSYEPEYAKFDKMRKKSRRK